MNNNLDLSKVQSYSTALSSKLCNGYFSSEEPITGNQIFRFCPVKQINVYIVKGLFEQWKEELSKLESPYFNYQNEEVKEALNGFMNTLSKNIAVGKKEFLPLVQKAIYDTLLICLSPELYFDAEYANELNYSKAQLSEKVKYTKVRPALVENFNSYVLSLKSEEVSGHDIKNFVSTISSFTNEDEEEATEILDSVSSLLEFHVKDFIIPSFSLEALQVNKPFGEDELLKVSEIVNKTANSVQSQRTTNQVLDKKSEQQLTLHESLKTTPETSIADRFSKTKIEDLKSSIPLNLKFLFINILFDGNSVDYAHALSQVEQVDSINKAKEVLSKNYASKYNWDLHSEEKEEFLKIIERKFY